VNLLPPAGGLGQSSRSPHPGRVEGTGTYGAGLTRHLTQAGVTVVEVDRPNRQRRRRRGKSVDCQSSPARFVAQQPTGGADPASAIHRALCHLARRHQALPAELAALNADLVALTRQAAPRLLARCGIGIETAGQLLVTAGDNLDRLRSDVPCRAVRRQSSGGLLGQDRPPSAESWRRPPGQQRPVGHRPDATAHRPGQPRLRRAAHRQGKTTKEIMRLLKRYLARELFPLLKADLHHAQQLN
jgi:hypothetical protein